MRSKGNEYQAIKYSREPILVVQYAIVGRSRSSEETAMALQVEIEFGRVNYVAIHNGTGRTVPTSICVFGRREEANVVAFPNDDNGNLGSYSYFLACL